MHKKIKKISFCEDSKNTADPAVQSVSSGSLPGSDEVQHITLRCILPSLYKGIFGGC